MNDAVVADVIRAADRPTLQTATAALLLWSDDETAPQQQLNDRSAQQHQQQQQLQDGSAQLNHSIIASTPLYLSRLFSTRAAHYHHDAYGHGAADGAAADGAGGGGLTTSRPALIPPPQHLFGDYVEMIYLGLVILAGTIINAYVLHKLLRERRRKACGKNSKGFILLKINLNLSDLLILVIHALGKLVWLAEYEWRFGEALCRAFNFLSMFTLYLSSNIVVCIAMDRLRTVVQARKPTVSSKQQSLIRIMVMMAWVLAFLWSLPQLYFWRTLNVFPDYPGGWIQCSDIWSIERHEMMRNVNHTPLDSIFISDFVQNLYDLTHLCFVFYGPLVLLIICYFFILIRLLRFAKTTTTATAAAANVELEKSGGKKVKNGFFAPASTPILNARRKTSSATQRRNSRMKKSLTVSSGNMSICERTKSNATASVVVESLEKRQIVLIKKGAVVQKRFSLALPLRRRVDRGAQRAANGSIGELSEFLVVVDDGTGASLEANGETSPPTTPNSCQKRRLPFADCERRRRPSIASSLALISSATTRRDHARYAHDNDVENNCFDTDSPLYSTYQTSTLDFPTGERVSFVRRCRHFFVDCVASRIGRVKHYTTQEAQSAHSERRSRRFSDSVMRNIAAHIHHYYYQIPKHRTQSLVESSELELAAQRRSSGRLNDRGKHVTSTNAIDKLVAATANHNNKHVMHKHNNNNNNNNNKRESICVATNGHAVRRTSRNHKHNHHTQNNNNNNNSQNNHNNHSSQHNNNIDDDNNSQKNKICGHKNSSCARNNSRTPYNNRIPYNNNNKMSNGAANWRSEAENERFLSSSTLNAHNIAATTTNNNNNSYNNSCGTTPKEPTRIPLWRRQMKSRVFRTTLLVIVTHVILWLPYNSYALMKYINLDLYMRMNEKANVLKDLQFLITIINPFLYGFSQQ